MDQLDTIYLTTPGTFVGIEHEAFTVRLPDDQTWHRVPSLRVESIVAWRGVTLSPDAMDRCVRLGISVTWITQNGRFVASLAGAEQGRAALRLAQCRAYDDPEHRLALARAFTAGKLQNYRRLVLGVARDATGARQQELRLLAVRHAEAVAQLPRAQSLTEVLGIEGRAARRYFDAAPLIFTAEQPKGRTRRPPMDPVNCYLSMGYGLLRSSVHAACVHAGLDPLIGYVHGIRGTKPALALDLMEEMRALLVDRLVASLVNRGQLVSSRHTRQLPGGSYEFTSDGLRVFMDAWAQSRGRTWHHGALSRDVTAAELPFVQARLLARHLREPEFAYTPWRAP